MALRAVEIPDITTTDHIGLDALESAPLRLGYAYWRSLRGDRPYPSRSDIRPRDIAGILRHVSLLKFENGDFVHRIVGDAIVRAFDIPLQNRTVSELAAEEPGFVALLRPLLEQCRVTGEPFAIRGQTGRDIFRITFSHHEAVFLPLGPDAATVDHVLVVSSLFSRS
ncbi:hypothetical protein FHS83_002179 [Rhizomicrobium palustre]|uniref:PAS domain-containing protein n=1 Tax=Rhizomicrobium palustre TaxID=189966 RepID=A0A846N0I6_9PROT|nr:PAS domain-containing protein [Rhizomicrobium palustre]NIK88861.1 hypothetical protein [Rhizomicrobium palustre]